MSFAFPMGFLCRKHRFNRSNYPILNSTPGTSRLTLMLFLRSDTVSPGEASRLSREQLISGFAWILEGLSPISFSCVARARLPAPTRKVRFFASGARGHLTGGWLNSINLLTLLSRGSFLLFVFLPCLIWVVNCGQPAPPYTPAEALTTFDIEAGFRIEVFASEPMILDPVAMEFDEHGRVFVVEMPGYPLDVGATGRVKLLEDTNQDGFPDQATVFVDGLVLPTGVLRWKKGILVTDAPNVWYFERHGRRQPCRSPTGPC